MSALDDLRAARALIADPSRWTTDATARNAQGDETDSWAPNAVCWCAIGAAIKTAASADLPGYCILQDAAWQLYGCAVSRVNDDLGHAAVLRVYDRAIELAGADHG